MAPGFYTIDKGRGALTVLMKHYEPVYPVLILSFVLLCFVSVVVFGCFVVDHHKPLFFLQPI